MRNLKFSLKVAAVTLLLMGGVGAQILPTHSVFAEQTQNNYIGEEKAKAAALSHAGVKEKNIQNYRCRLDYDDGLVHYEIDFDCNGYEYDYEIDCLDGSVLKFEKEKLVKVSSSQSKTYIKKSTAKSAVLSHAGVKAKNITNYRCKLDYDDGSAVYEIDFDSNGYEYEYEVDALDGSILKSKKELLAVTPTHSSTESGSRIGKTKAKTIAFSHAGVKAKNVTNYRGKLDYDDGYLVYELDFECNGYEYEYEIDALDGTVLKSKKEMANDTVSDQNDSYIGTSKATAAALSHAGVSKQKAQKLKCELEHDDGYTYYEVEFKSGNYEYEYEIDAFTGKIRKHEKEWDD